MSPLFGSRRVFGGGGSDPSSASNPAASAPADPNAAADAVPSVPMPPPMPTFAAGGGAAPAPDAGPEATPPQPSWTTKLDAATGAPIAPPPPIAPAPARPASYAPLPAMAPPLAPGRFSGPPLPGAAPDRPRTSPFSAPAVPPPVPAGPPPVPGVVSAPGPGSAPSTGGGSPLQATAAAGHSPFTPGGLPQLSEYELRNPSVVALLRMAIALGASDLHLSTGIPPTIRVDGFLERMQQFAPLTAEQLQKMVYSVLNDEQKKKFEETWELDFSCEMQSAGRFRVNVHRQRGATEAAFRIVSDTIRSLKKLGLPPIVEELARRDSGLVLVTGPTGSGKTTTLAAMIDLINMERQCMIITVEDPIEYVHPNKRSIIKQREVFSDTKSFSAALRHVLRQDPDVIVVGEMRDLETISTAITAAETGHLVIATLHTSDAMQTIDRIVDVFPPHQQEQIRIQMANCLEGIVSQQLLPIAGSRGRVAAVEILIATTAVRKIIRTAKTEQITTMMQTNWEAGMVTMDRSLKNLYAQGLITYDDAISKCRYPENFDQL